MNSRQRIAAAMQGEPVDHPAFCPVLSLYGAKLIECPLERYYRDPEAYAKGQQAVVDAFRPDVLFAPFAMATLGEAFGGELRWFSDQPPNLRRPAIHSADDISSLTVPDLDNHPILLYFRESIRLLASTHGRQKIIGAVLPGPFDLPIMMMGLEAWLDAVLCSPDSVRRVLDVSVPFFLQWVNAVRADGADALVLLTPFVTSAVVTPELAERVVVPVLHEVFERLPCSVILHCVGGPFLPLLPLLTGLPNVGGVVVDHGEDLSKAREIIGPERLLFGGIDGGRIWHSSADALMREARTVLRERRGDHRFIFATLGPDVAWATTPEQIEAIGKAIEKHLGD